MSTEIIFLGVIILIAAIDYFFKKNKTTDLLDVNNKPKINPQRWFSFR